MPYAMILKLSALIVFVSLLNLFNAAFASLIPTVNNDNTVITVSGVRESSTAWGLGPVNYQAGATSKERLAGSGFLEFDIIGTCADSGFGNGTGYKALVQFWNDEQNYIAMGIVHDPGVSPDGMTVMVEGAAYSQPIGGYWGAGSPVLTGSSHHIAISWTPSQISWVIDYLEGNRMTFNIQMNNPSISFLAAARLPGDSLCVRFENIQFMNPVIFLPLTWDITLTPTPTPTPTPVPTPAPSNSNCNDFSFTPNSEEYELYTLINQYRQQNGLPSVNLSKSLTYVARTHVQDMDQYPPSDPCTLLSWSSNGIWSSCCYTPDHENASCTWDKPRELTPYEGDGNEIYAWDTSGMDAETAIDIWKEIPSVIVTILNKGEWSDYNWNSMGVGLYGIYAVVWFGEETDPCGYF